MADNWRPSLTTAVDGNHQAWMMGRAPQRPVKAGTWFGWRLPVTNACQEREEAKVVGNTAARRLFDSGVVVKRVLRRDDRIREAVSPYLSRLCRRKLAAALARATRPTSPMMLVHLFETRVKAETWMAAWQGAESAACGGLKSPSGGLPWIA